MCQKKQPDHRAHNSRRPPMGLQCGEKLRHPEASFSRLVNKYVQQFSDNGCHTKLRIIHRKLKLKMIYANKSNFYPNVWLKYFTQQVRVIIYIHPMNFRNKLVYTSRFRPLLYMINNLMNNYSSLIENGYAALTCYQNDQSVFFLICLFCFKHIDVIGITVRVIVMVLLITVSVHDVSVFIHS